MQKPNSHSINEATQRAKQRLPIENLKETSKYKNITKQEYNQLFEFAEAVSLLILESFSKNEVIE